MVTLRWMLLVVAAMSLLASMSARADGRVFHAVMAEFRPLQYQDDGQIRGYAADIVREVVKDLDQEGKTSALRMEMMPWKRATVISARAANTLFFSIARTPEREERYHWIGEISPYVVGFVGLDGKLSSDIADTGSLMASGAKVAVQRASNAAALLKRLGYMEGDDFSTYNHYRDGVRMLFAGRIDALPLTVMFFRNNACNQGLDGDRMKVLFEIQELSRPLWMVASKKTDSVVADNLRKSFRSKQEAGFIAQKQQEYLDVWQKMECLPNNAS